MTNPLKHGLIWQLRTADDGVFRSIVIDDSKRCKLYRKVRKK